MDFYFRRVDKPPASKLTAPPDDLLQEINAITTDKIDKYDDIWASWLSSSPLNIPSTAVDVSDSVWEDAGVVPWINHNRHLLGTKDIAWHIFSRPQTDITLLRQRQQAVKYIPGNMRKLLQSSVVPIEKDVLWLFTLPSIKECDALQLLFPQAFGLRLLNQLPFVLATFHIYRAFLAPWMTLLTPLTPIFGPYYYLRKTLKFPISLKQYCIMLSGIVRTVLKPTGDYRTDSARYSSILMYLMVFVLGTMQSFELSKTLRGLRKCIHERTRSIRNFVATSTSVLSTFPDSFWHAFGMTPFHSYLPLLSIKNAGVPGIYQILSDTRLQTAIRDAMLRFYVLDTCVVMQQVARRGCFVQFVQSPSIVSDAIPVPLTFFNMGHVSLPPNQVKNPACLQRNLVITGPNAAGKTTYVKSICANVLLAQTFGVCLAQRGIVPPVNAIGSFMRIHDVLGDCSLFEAEVKRCSYIVRQAEAVSAAGKTALYFLDEPLHSTPPIEGAATSLAIIEYMARLPGIRVITTTHYFAITRLATTYPSLFQNVSMEAVATDKSSEFIFPYKIRNGPSFQCIALELLDNEHHQLPSSIIKSAMEWKNKLCAREVEVKK